MNKLSRIAAKEPIQALHLNHCVAPCIPGDDMDETSSKGPHVIWVLIVFAPSFKTWMEAAPAVVQAQYAHNPSAWRHPTFIKSRQAFVTEFASKPADPVSLCAKAGSCLKTSTPSPDECVPMCRAAPAFPGDDVDVASLSSTNSSHTAVSGHTATSNHTATSHGTRVSQSTAATSHGPSSAVSSQIQVGSAT